MCGIAGFVGKGGEDTLQNMARAIAHRGPDASAVWHGQNAGLVHTRLAVIDLSPGGAQPMHDASERYTIVFNGEIYNYKELKKELVSYPFRSQSDTEVILAAYQAWGMKAFARLDGMFALAVWDKQERELVLARDPLGKKPLYWTLQDGIFVFGSELKALWEHPQISKELDPRSLAHYLAREYVPTPRSIYKDIRKLMPGSSLRLREGSVTQERFWKPDTAHHPAPSEQEALKRFDELLDNAVAKRLVTDVPLGIFLSGGLDSSSVAYYAARHGALETFSIGFAEKEFDESVQAALVAKHLGTNHHSHTLSEADALSLIHEIPDVFDEPVADASVLPTLLLSRFARESVTVTLGGDGADELLMGYPTFRAEEYASFYGALPSFIRKAIASSTGLLPASAGYFGLAFKAQKFTEDFDTNASVRHLQWLGSLTEKDLDSLLQPHMRQESAGITRELISQWSEEFASPELLNTLSHLYLRTYCMDDVLVKVDRASMRYGLEVRTPFLDPALVSFLLSLPPELKYRGGEGKRLLRKLMQDKLPAEILTRKKQGFAAPMAAWLRGPLKPLCEDLVSPARLKAQGIFEYAPVERLMREHMEGVRDNRKKLWTLMVFQLWYERYMR